MFTFSIGTISDTAMDRAERRTDRFRFDITYTRQLKLAELREARINIRQDRVCPPPLLGEVKIGRQKEAWRFLFSYT